MQRLPFGLMPRLTTVCLAIALVAWLLPCPDLRAQGPVPRWGVAEFALEYHGAVANPFLEVAAVGEFSGPGYTGITRMEGFYDGEGIWKFRFAPRREGAWKVRLSLSHAGQEVAARVDSFECRGGRGHGFLQRSRVNPYRLEYEDGTPFYAVGIQPCGSTEEGLDGPPAAEGVWRSVPMDTFLSTFQGAANLFRIQLGAGTRAGCAREIMTDSLGLYRYNLEACRQLDETYSLLAKYGFSTILIPFQDMSLWGTDTTIFGPNDVVSGWKDIDNREAVDPVFHYLRYVAARWAAYTDIWELFNEDVFTPDAWLEAAAAHLRRHDPYGHLLTTNYERPLADWSDLVTFHIYMGIPAWETESQLTKEFGRLKSFGKPVLNTEFGNQGHLSNHDPLKWRIAVWTAFMNEGSMLFWSMGGRLLPEAPQGRRGNANAYLGPEARQYFRNHLEFVRDLPADLRPVLVGFSGRDGLNRYALSNGKITVLYLHHYKGYDHATSGEVFLVTGGGPGRYELEWYDPAQGRVVKTEQVETASGTLDFDCPEVTTDLAARIRRME